MTSKRTPPSPSTSHDSNIDSGASSTGESEYVSLETPLNPSKLPAKLPQIFGSKKGKRHDSPLLWMIDPDELELESVTLIRKWNSEIINQSGSPVLAGEVIRAVESMDGQPKTPTDALVRMAACHCLPEINGMLEPDSWNRLIADLLDNTGTADGNSDSPDLMVQWLSVEVPITIAFQIPGIENRQQMVEQSADHLATLVGEMLDHDGWPSAEYLESFGLWAASWARCFMMLKKLDARLDFETVSKSEWLVRQIIRLARPDGTLAFSTPQSGRLTKPFLKTLRKLSQDRMDKKLLRAFSSDSRRAATLRKIADPSLLSQWSESAILQSTWELTSPTVAIDYSNRQCRVEISRDVPLIQGNCLPEISLNGVTLKPTESFEVVCEQSDDDLDYVELEMELDSNVRLNRQFLLSRTDEFLLVADLVKPSQASRIDYRCRWPVADNVEGMPESETREIYLRSPSIQSLVLPLALPEWKLNTTDDQLTSDEGQLCLVQSIDGLGLYAPLLFDLNPGRSRCKRTWRQLTVAEDRQIVPRDVGSAYRFQLDKQQWVFYRAVSSTGNRTFIGENLICEFVFDRFEKNGTVRQLIEIK